eukprot:2351240-Prymnesium_polylepis.1
MAGLGDYLRVSGAETGCVAPFPTLCPSVRPSVSSDVREPGCTLIAKFGSPTIGRSAATAVYWSERREGHQ